MRSWIGKFEILRLLGNGAMGEVYLARDENLGREVAVKIIAPENAFGAESRARFQREARAMAALNHPNIVTIFDFGLADGLDYLVMEYLEGEDLRGLLEHNTRSKAELLEALAQACDGLGYAHGRGVVHRDVKPGNILVARRGDKVQAKLMDFGIAALEHSQLTQQGAWMGTLSYMAPEYLDSGKPTPSGDLFAVGVILYEILSSGRLPFTGETATGIINAILTKPPAALGPVDPGEVPEALVAVMEKALAKDPAQRFATADGLALAIRAALAEPLKPEPVQPIVVGRGGRATCLNLRAALRRARPGEVIRILPGEYPEAIQVAQEVSLQGEGDPGGVVFSGGLSVLAGGSLNLANATVGNASGVALRVLPGARLEASDVFFQGAPAGGAELGPGTSARFLRCHFQGNGCAGLLALEQSRAVLEDCELSGNQDAGAHAAPGCGVRMKLCRLVRNQGLGISAADEADVALERCEVSGNLGLGIACRQGTRLSLQACRIEDRIVRVC